MLSPNPLLRSHLPIVLGAAVLLAAAATVAAPAKSRDDEKAKNEEWARTLDRATVHRAVQRHENDPLGGDAKDLRAILKVHFEPVHYVVCLDQIGFLLNLKDKAYEAVFWQVVFGSGDYFEQGGAHPTDQSTYMLYGLQSGLKAYENILVKRPKIRLKELDDLIALRDAGRLPEYVKSRPCERKFEKEESHP